MNTKEIGFSRKFDTAVALVERVKTMTVRNAQEFTTAEGELKTIRELEKELDQEYREHPVIIEAKRMQGIKSDLAALLENARKGLKNGPMLAYEQAEEAKRQAEERRLQAEAKKLADAETARQVAEQKRQFNIAEKARMAAEKSGNDAAALRAAIKAQAAQDEARAIIHDAAQAIAPVVVIEKTAPSVSRRMVAKFHITNADLLPRQYLMPNEVAIGGVIRSLRANHGIPGVEYFEVPA